MGRPSRSKARQTQPDPGPPLPSPAPLGIGWRRQLALWLVRGHAWGDHLLHRLGFPEYTLPSPQPGLTESGERPPDAALGLVLTPDDAPILFEMLDRLARKLTTRRPREVRLTFLPTCGVLEFTVRPGVERPVLVLGLPVLHVWSVEELESVLAHELAHLRHQDVEFQRQVLGWSQSLRETLEQQAPMQRDGWRHWWARQMLGWVESLARPVSRQMEFRADECSAAACGPEALASALEKLAVLQPIFGEILGRADPTESSNVYRQFARTWKQLKGDSFEKLRQRLIDQQPTGQEDLHPPIRQRLDRLRSNPPTETLLSYPSLHVLDDPAQLEQLLHNHLFSLATERPTTFRPALDPSNRVD